METYTLLSLMAGSIAVGMVLGAWAFKKDRDKYRSENVKLKMEIKMADLSLASSRNANEACYDVGFRDGKAAQIKELGKALLSESTVLRDGSIAKLHDDKLGPKKGAA